MQNRYGDGLTLFFAARTIEERLAKNIER